MAVTWRSSFTPNHHIPSSDDCMFRQAEVERHLRNIANLAYLDLHAFRQAEVERHKQELARAKKEKEEEEERLKSEAARCEQ